MNSEDFFSNRELKALFKNHYGDDICCSSPQEAKKSVMIFLKSLSTEDLADTISANDPIRESGKIIRGLLLQENFDLQDKFCDAHDLEESRKNIVVPEQKTIFLATLCMPVVLGLLMGRDWFWCPLSFFGVGGAVGLGALD